MITTSNSLPWLSFLYSSGSMVMLIIEPAYRLLLLSLFPAQSKGRNTRVISSARRLHSPNYSDRVSNCVYLLHAGVFKTLLCTFGFSYNNGIQITRIVSKHNSHLYVVAMTSSRQQAIPLFSIVPPLSTHVLPSFTKFEENDRLLAV